MKKVFLSVIGFYWLTTVAIPMLYIMLFGYTKTSSVENEYAYKAALLMTIVLLIASILIFLTPNDDNRLDTIISRNYHYVEVVSVFHIVMIFIIGGGIIGFLNSVLSGGVNGTLYNYLSIFLDVAPLMIIKIFSEEKKNIAVPALIYVLYTLINTSRAGFMYLILFYYCARVASRKYASGNTKRDMFIGAAVVASPFAFVYVSSVRGFHFEGIKLVFDNIVSRLSSIGLLGRVIRAYEMGDYVDYVFADKYSFSHQLQLIVNSILPGDVFASDVMPNQYFRAIFSGYTVEWARNNYMSVNMTLPGYFLLKYSLIPSIVISVILIYFLYKICEKHRDNNFFRILAITGLWELLYFFDWNMIFVRVERIALTVWLYYEYRMLREYGILNFGIFRIRVLKVRGGEICLK